MSDESVDFDFDEALSREIRPNPDSFEPYLFQPTKRRRFEPSEESSVATSESESSEESSDPDSEGPSRLTHTDWCQCGRCELTTLTEEREAKCCHEQCPERDLGDAAVIDCITEDSTTPQTAPAPS